jgi:hypothetical protein
MPNLPYRSDIGCCICNNLLSGTRCNDANGTTPLARQKPTLASDLVVYNEGNHSLSCEWAAAQPNEVRAGATDSLAPDMSYPPIEETKDDDRDSDQEGEYGLALVAVVVQLHLSDAVEVPRLKAPGADVPFPSPGQIMTPQDPRDHIERVWVDGYGECTIAIKSHVDSQTPTMHRPAGESDACSTARLVELLLLDERAICAGVRQYHPSLEALVHDVCPRHRGIALELSTALDSAEVARIESAVYRWCRPCGPSDR